MSRKKASVASAGLAKTAANATSRYPQLYEDEWYICEQEFDLACCDCLLVHGVFFKVELVEGKPALHIRFERNNRATAQLRRHRKRK